MGDFYSKGPPPKESAIDDLANFGAPPELISELDTGPEALEVFEENWEAVILFLKLSTQWRTSFSGVSGLEYKSVMILFDLYDVKNRREVFEDIQVIEMAALKNFNAKE